MPLANLFIAILLVIESDLQGEIYKTTDLADKDNLLMKQRKVLFAMSDSIKLG